MAKRDILRAAKKAGVTVVDLYYSWQATPGEMVPCWTVEFGPELDYEIEFFGDTEEAVAWIEENATDMAKELADATQPAGDVGRPDA